MPELAQREGFYQSPYPLSTLERQILEQIDAGVNNAARLVTRHETYVPPVSMTEVQLALAHLADSLMMTKRTEGTFTGVERRPASEVIEGYVTKQLREAAKI